MSRRHSSGSGGGNKKPPDISLLMECYDEEPTKEQQAAYNKGEKEYQEVVAKLEKYVKSMEAEMIEKISDQTYVLQMNATGNAPNPVVNVTAATPTTKVANTPLTRQQAAMITQPPPNSNIVQTPNGPVILQNSPQQASGVVTRGSSANTLHTAGGTYQLVMDPRLGLIVGAVTSPQNAPVIQSTTSLASKTTPITQVTSSSRSNIQTRTRGQITPTQTPPGQKTPVAAPKQNLVPLTPAGRGRGKPSITMPRPTESNSVGGLSAGSNKPKSAPPGSAPIVDLTDDDARPTGSGNVVADSREVTFNKLSGKTFPSLVVVARPNLRVKLIPQSTVTQERTELDTKVKSVLMFTPTKFTEWLIQKGLVRSEQYCATHLTADSPPVRLKLGMYSDVSKFPYSGGYVWISECCPQRFVSVFHGSIFEGAPHPPTVLLKLMYHWSCQTNVQNVVQWVKVDNFYVKNFFSNMRSVCTAAVHEKYEKMGGPRKKIEVGVISLGTTSQDGNMRQVKVEVLGVMDHENNLIRLRAVEPLQDGERNYKRRFVKILEPLDQWVDKESSILTDFTVDKGTLHSMGFNQVYQVSVNEAPSTNNKFSNHNVMEYLRRIVPRMFQNTLSLLSRQIIQQFLDELVWRERWGPVPSQAFDNIIQHMAEQTKLDTGDSLLTRLAKVAANPFKLWTYASWKPPTPAIVTNGTTAKPPGSTQVGAKSMPAPLPPLRPVPASRPGPSSRPGPASRSAPASRPTPAENAVVSSIDMLPQSIRETPGPKRSRKRGAAGEASTPPETKRVATPPQPKSVATLPQPKRGVTPPQSDEQTALDVYYYGSLDGDPNVIKGEYKTNLDVKCCVCHRKFTNNIQLMKHLIMHVQSNSEFTTELSDLTQCKYCFKSFPTPYAMQNHMEDLHMKTNASLVCRICEDKFRDRLSLITHMHKNHVAMELPYECGICKFRSSMHKDIIDHFYEVHSGGEKLQCPFCLKVVAVGNNGKKISANINFFLNHMQKHQRKSLARKCNKCALWFVHKGILKEHQIKDHSSFKGMPGTKQYLNQNGIEVMMPVPTAYPSSQRGGPLQKKGSPQLRTAYNMKKFEQLNIQGVETGAVCCECEGDMLGEEHFPGYLQCMRCRYSTCCSKAMNEHTVVFHDTARPPEFSLGRVVQLSKEMHCVCGFKSAKGNRLATHLTRCERKSAYPSPAHAKAATVQSASFPPLVTLDDADNAEDDPSDRWLKAFVPSRKDEGEGTKDQPDKKVSAQSGGGDPPSMLNILGLVRKPSTDESSLDKAPSDNEGATDSKMEAEKGESTSLGAEDKMEVDDSDTKDLKEFVGDSGAKEEEKRVASTGRESKLGTGGNSSLLGEDTDVRSSLLGSPVEAVDNSSDKNTPSIVNDTRSSNAEDEIGKSSNVEDEIGKSSNAEDGIGKSSNAEDKIGKSSNPEDEIGKSSNPEDEIEKSSIVEDGIEKALNAEDEMEVSSSVEDELEKLSNVEDELEKSSSVEDEIEKLSNVEDGMELPSNIEDGIENTSHSRGEVEPPVIEDHMEKLANVEVEMEDNLSVVEDELEKSSNVEEGMEQSSIVGDDVEKSSNIEEETEKSSIVGDEVEKLSIAGDEMEKSSNIEDEFEKSSLVDNLSGKENLPVCEEDNGSVADGDEENIPFVGLEDESRLLSDNQEGGILSNNETPPMLEAQDSSNTNMLLSEVNQKPLVEAMEAGSSSLPTVQPELDSFLTNDSAMPTINYGPPALSKEVEPMDEG